LSRERRSTFPGTERKNPCHMARVLLLKSFTNQASMPGILCKSLHILNGSTDHLSKDQTVE